MKKSFAQKIEGETDGVAWEVKRRETLIGMRWVFLVSGQHSGSCSSQAGAVASAIECAERVARNGSTSKGGAS